MFVSFNMHRDLSILLKITEAIRRYGVSDSTTALFVARVTDPKTLSPEDAQVKMDAVVDGKVTAFNALEQLTDWAAVRKVCQPLSCFPTFR